MNSKSWTVLGVGLGLLGMISGFGVCMWMFGGDEPTHPPRYDQGVSVVRAAESTPTPPAAGPSGEAGTQASLPSPGGASPASSSPDASPPGQPGSTPQDGASGQPSAGSPGPTASRLPELPVDRNPDRMTSVLGTRREVPAAPGHARDAKPPRRVAQGPSGPEPPLNQPGSGETPEQPTPTPEAKPKDDASPAPKAGKSAKTGKPAKAGKAAKPAKKEKGEGGKDDAGAPPILHDRARDLNKWKPGIVKYCKRHYGEDSWKLEPTCIVLHFTAGSSFPWNLVNTTSSDGEVPGLAVHYVVDGTKIWEILPPTIRSRGAYGINHRAINIEMVATSAADLARRRDTLKTCTTLVKYLMDRFDIPKNKIYSHSEVSNMDARRVPEVKDLVNSSPYGKPDPGEQNMKTIKARL